MTKKKRALPVAEAAASNDDLEPQEPAWLERLEIDGETLMGLFSDGSGLPLSGPNSELEALIDILRRAPGVTLYVEGVRLGHRDFSYEDQHHRLMRAANWFLARRDADD